MVKKSLPTMGKNMKKILFLCVANSACSQMAEGLARNLLSESYLVFSAGSNPSSVNPNAIEVMNEIGIDISKQFSKSVDSFNVNDFDFIITLCAEEICPFVVSKAKRLHWPFPDPAKKNGEQKDILQNFRTVRDNINKRIQSEFCLCN